MAAPWCTRFLRLNYMKFTRISSYPCYKISQNGCIRSQCLSTEAVDRPSEHSSLAQAFKQASVHHTRKDIFRTTENDPTKHTDVHEGLYYTVDPDDYHKYVLKGPHNKFEKMGQTFNEHCIMVRKPATEIFQCLRMSNMSLPVIRYVIYGRHGVGKSVTLAHVMHHCGSKGWLVVHVPWAEILVQRAKEVQPSSYTAGLVDTPVECAVWLAGFQTMNRHLISQLTTKHTYTWSKREATEAGSPWLQLLDVAFSRPKYAADVLGAVLKEVRHSSSDGTTQTLVAIDSVNSLWNKTAVRTIDNITKSYGPEELSIVHHMKRMLTNNWSGGAVVVVVDINASRDKRESYLPRYILTKEAVDWLEPHIPIHVNNFTEKEAASCLEYFTDRKWIQKLEGLTEDGKQEILFLSSRNPLEIYNVCARW